MAVKTKSKGAAITVRRAAPMVPKKKYEGLIEARTRATKKAKEVAQRRLGAIVGVGACAAVGYLEKTGKIPAVGGFESTAVIGAVGVALGFLVPELVKGNAGQMAAEAGAAITGVAAYKLAMGAPLRVAVAGEDWE